MNKTKTPITKLTRTSQYILEGSRLFGQRRASIYDSLECPVLPYGKNEANKTNALSACTFATIIRNFNKKEQQ